MQGGVKEKEESYVKSDSRPNMILLQRKAMMPFSNFIGLSLQRAKSVALNVLQVFKRGR